MPMDFTKHSDMPISKAECPKVCAQWERTIARDAAASEQAHAARMRLHHRNLGTVKMPTHGGRED